MKSRKLPISPLQVILESKTGQAELELFPRYLLFLRQQPATRSPQSNIWVNMGMTSLRMFPPYLPPPRGNVSLQQDQNKPSTNASLSYLASLPFNPPKVDRSSPGRFLVWAVEWTNGWSRGQTAGHSNGCIIQTIQSSQTLPFKSYTVACISIHPLWNSIWLK